MDLLEFNVCVRRSSRARHISLRIVPGHGVEVVLPLGVSEDSGLQFLKKNRAWVEKHYEPSIVESVEAKPARYPLTQEINLRCVNQIFKVVYLQRNSKQIQLRSPLPQVLIFTGKIKDARCCQPKLDKWLRQQGQAYLLPILDRLSQETGLVFNKASIRLQRSRWGSCSEKGDITLNARLLYFDYEVVRYVLIHELCHLKELNHSRQFWKWVEHFEPRYRELKAALHAQKI